MRVGWGAEVWSDGKTHEERRFKKAEIPPLGVTLKDMPSQKFAMDTWAQMGGTSIAISVPWDSVHVQPDQFIFEPLDWILDYALCKKMKVVLKVQADHNKEKHVPADWRVPDSDTARDKNGAILADKGLSFSSSKWESNYNKYITKLADHIYQTGRSSAVYYVMPATTSDQEFGYQHDERGKDYSSLETNAWREWLKNKYGSNQPYGNINTLDQPDNIGNGGIGLDWFLFRTERLNRIAKMFAETFQAKGFKTVLDSGSFVDQSYQRNSWGLTAGGGASYVSGFKQNPQSNYNPELNAKILSCSGKWSSNEWTLFREDFLPITQQDANNYIGRVKKSVDGGVSDISYAFMEPVQRPETSGLEYGHYTVAPFLENIMNSMKDSGYLSKKQQCKTSYSKNLIFSLSQVLNDRGFSRYENELRSAIEQNGITNTCVELKNDVGINF